MGSQLRTCSTVTQKIPARDIEIVRQETDDLMKTCSPIPVFLGRHNVNQAARLPP